MTYSVLYLMGCKCTWYARDVEVSLRTSDLHTVECYCAVDTSYLWSYYKYNHLKIFRRKKNEGLERWLSI